MAGAPFGAAREGRITEINGFRIEAIPTGHMLVTRNVDVPGVIGRLGTILGAHGVNISRFHLGRRERGGEAMAVIEIDAPPDEATLPTVGVGTPFWVNGSSVTSALMSCCENMTVSPPDRARETSPMRVRSR